MPEELAMERTRQKYFGGIWDHMFQIVISFLSVSLISKTINIAGDLWPGMAAQALRSFSSINQGDSGTIETISRVTFYSV